MLKTAFVFGGAYAVGSIGGAKVAELAKISTPGAVTGVKIGTGVVAFYLLSMLLR